MRRRAPLLRALPARVVLSAVLLAGVLHGPAPTVPIAETSAPITETSAPTAERAAPTAEADDLVGRLAGLQTRLADLTDGVGDRLEVTNRAIVDEDAARARADTARGEADAARAVADGASTASEAARRRVDEWVAAQYQQANAGSLGSAIVGSQGPADLLDRAALLDAVTADQSRALADLRVAEVRAGDDEARATATASEAEATAVGATQARTGAETALARARTGVEIQMRTIAEVTGQRDATDTRLRALEVSDSALAERLRRAQALDTASVSAASASDAAERAAAVARLAADATAGRSTAVRATARPPARRTATQTVLDRALSQLGTPYAWGGGTASGPSRGVRDGGVADRFGDFRKTGFDCSGLMIYAFAGAGKKLPHYSGYQATSGRRVPLAQRRPGDMLFWADTEGIHHVALYLGNDRMVEAPASGKVVRRTTVRFSDQIVPQVTRLLP